MPDQVIEEEAEAPKRRATNAVPIFNAGVMGELNKKLGVKTLLRKKSAEKTAVASPEPATQNEQSKIALPKVQTPLTQVK